MHSVHWAEPLPSFDNDGLLIESEQWNESVASLIASLNGIHHLGRDHWRVILALRQHYDRHGTAPVMSHICREQGENRNWIHDLFGSCLNAWRVAGLPDPGEEAKAYLNDF